MKIVFQDTELILDIDKYSNNNRLYIGLFEEETGEYYMDATVNLPEVELAEDEVAIKNYSENEGILETLIEAGVVSSPIRTVQSGWVTIPIVKVLNLD